MQNSLRREEKQGNPPRSAALRGITLIKLHSNFDIFQAENRYNLADGFLLTLAHGNFEYDFMVSFTSRALNFPMGVLRKEDGKYAFFQLDGEIVAFVSGVGHVFLRVVHPTGKLVSGRITDQLFSALKDELDIDKVLVVFPGDALRVFDNFRFKNPEYRVAAPSGKIRINAGFKPGKIVMLQNGYGIIQLFGHAEIKSQVV